MPEIDVEHLSCDQAYLFRIISAIKSKSISQDLLQERPGPMSQARWLTTANWICRLYVSLETPSDELSLVASFIVNFYGPMWFKIKKQWQFEYGAQHYLDQISLLYLFPIKVRNVVWPVLKRNSYWAHSENVIITLLAHENDNKRKFAIDLINKIRCKKENVLRQFKLPLIKESVRSQTVLWATTYKIFNRRWA